MLCQTDHDLYYLKPVVHVIGIPNSIVTHSRNSSGTGELLPSVSTDEPQGLTLRFFICAATNTILFGGVEVRRSFKYWFGRFHYLRCEKGALRSMPGRVRSMTPIAGNEYSGDHRLPLLGLLRARVLSEPRASSKATPTRRGAIRALTCDLRTYMLVVFFVCLNIVQFRWPYSDR